MKKSIILVLIFIAFPTFVIIAGKPPIKYGKVAIEDLQMTSYEADTSAPAVILCDYGVFRANTFLFTRTLRIKILNKEGYEWANKVFETRDKTNVKGITFNLVDNEIVKTKLKSESIFKEKVTDDLYRIRVAMPNVKVGSVIDLEFTYSGIPWEWYFQETIPVVWSELIMEQSQYVSFRKNFYGFEPLLISTNGQWACKDMPAFKPEPYLNSIENYLTKIEFDILDISFPGYYYESFTTSWEDLSDYLDDHTYFGLAMRNAGYMNSVAKEIKAMNLSSREELLKASFEKIKEFKWNHEERLLTTKTNISSSYKEKVGNSSDINIALIQLLRKLDYNVTPVVLSTRDNGILPLFHPSLNKLNYVIAKVELNDKTYLLDATEEYATFDILPFRCLNWHGYEVDEKLSEKVDLTTDKKDKEQIQITLKLDDNLNLKGNAKFVRKDYAALKFRNNYHSFNSQEEYLDDFVKNHSGVRIKSFEVENLDSLHLAIKDSYELSIKNSGEEIGDEIYIYPMVIDRLKENPFKLEERQYPIDYGHKYEKMYLVNISLPENFTIESVPEQVVMKLPDNSVNFTYQISTFNNSINLVFKYMINKAVFVEDEYETLKELYNQMVIKHSEPIILKKN